MRLWLVVVYFFYGCASEEKPESKAHPATWVTDTFPVEHGMPIRETKKQEFFFKKCALEGRRPYITTTEYSCNKGPF